jgi:hypothetical protein
MRASAIACGAVVAAVAAGVASADVLFDNFGPGDTYALDRGQTLAWGGPLGGDVYEAAAPITVTGGDYYLNRAEIAILHSWGPDLVYADIRADDGGAPGAVLETTSGSGVTPPFVWAPPMQLQFSGDLVLKDGETYWLALRTEETDALLAWSLNVVDDFGLRAWRINMQPWEVGVGVPGTDSQRQVYRIHGTVVPGPGSIWLGALALAAARRRRR